jgi:hypothetical protein
MKGYKPSIVRRRILEVYAEGTEIPFGAESIRMIKRRYQGAIEAMYPTPLAVKPEIYAEHFYRLMGYLFGNPNEPFQRMKPDFFGPNHWNALAAWYTPTQKDREAHEGPEFRNMQERFEFKTEVNWMCNRAFLAEVMTQRAIRNHQRTGRNEPNEPRGPYEPIPYALKRPIPWLSEIIYEQEYTMDGHADPGIVFPEGGMVEFALKNLNADIRPEPVDAPLPEKKSEEQIMRELGFGAWLDASKG